jgi:Mg2+ and Co2+ transporter CorA
MQQIEEAACSGVARVAFTVSEFLRAGLGDVQKRTASGRYPVDEFLWWHRVASGGRNSDEFATQMAGAVRRAVTSGNELVVTDGYTVLVDGTEEDLRAVVRGIVDAQEVWLSGETASREVITQIAALQSASGLSDEQLTHAVRVANQIAEAQELRAAVLQDQVRYTTGVRRVTLDAAAEAWGMSLELSAVNKHLTSLRAMLQRRVAERRLRLESRLSLGVFLLAVLSSFGLVLAFFETAFGLRLDYFPERMAFSGTVLMVAIMTGVLCVWYVRRNKV